MMSVCIRPSCTGIVFTSTSAGRPVGRSAGRLVLEDICASERESWASSKSCAAAPQRSAEAAKATLVETPLQRRPPRRALQRGKATLKRDSHVPASRENQGSARPTVLHVASCLGTMKFTMMITHIYSCYTGSMRATSAQLLRSVRVISGEL